MQSIKGTRDFYPEDKAIQNYIFDIWTKVAVKYGFQEMDGPILEPAEMWAVKGDELGDQLYSFTDKGGRKNVLRPEMTPTVARMVAARSNLPKPIKWFSIQRLFRYEAPQKGRLREFWQLNMDVLGLDSPIADAEIIATIASLMRALSCTSKDFVIRVNSRELMDAVLKDLEVKNSANIFRIIDKKDKVSNNDFKEMLSDEGLSTTQINKLNKFLNLNSLDEINYPEASKLKEVFAYLKSFKASKYCVFDPSIVRGLSYYTGTVFEVTDTEKKYRALAGGGRYDNLVSKYSNEEIPGVGYGMGDVPIQVFLEAIGKMPKVKPRIDYFVAVADDKSIKKALEIANKLRENNNVEMNLASRSLGKQFQYAANKGIPKVIVVGQKDLLKKQVTIKIMNDGTQKIIKLTSLEKL